MPASGREHVLGQPRNDGCSSRYRTKGLAHRASQAALLDAAPPAARGQTAATFYLVGYLAIAVIFVSLGRVIDASGPLAGLTGFAALTISAAVIAVVLLGPRPQPSGSYECGPHGLDSND